MEEKNKKIISKLLCFTMVFSMLAQPVHALPNSNDEPNELESQVLYQIRSRL